MGINKLHSQFCSGDQAVEGLLFATLSERFKVFARQRVRNEQDAEEIVQDALTTIARRFKDIEFKTSFAAWAYRVLENKILTFYRDSKSARTKLERVADRAEAAPESIPDPALKSALLECLRKVARANMRHARILNLHYLGYTVEEICQRLGLTRNNMYIMLSRGRASLKACLEGEDKD